MERSINWGDDIWSLHSNQAEAEVNMMQKIERVMEDLKADAMVVALTDTGENFRKSILPTYKGNRKDVRKPLLLSHLKDHLRATYEVYDRPTLEADDILGILSTGQKIKGEKIIVSIDKDLKSIPGLLYNDSKPMDGIIEVTEAEADYWHMMQTLTGDVTDGYAGCPGVGPKKAEAILFGVSPPWGCISEVWPAVVQAFVKAKLGEEEALRQARVARILRTSDYDFKNKKPILWTP
jgi:DNA polymerase-1